MFMTRQDKIDDVKHNFYNELEHAFHKFPKYHTKILLGNSNAKEGREDMFKLTSGNESLHEISNDNRRVVNFDTSKNLKKVQSCHIATSINILRCSLIGKPTISLTIF
jgi:hypothetical protein